MNEVRTTLASNVDHFVAASGTSLHKLMKAIHTADVDAIKSNFQLLKESAITRRIPTLVRSSTAYRVELASLVNDLGAPAKIFFGVATTAAGAILWKEGAAIGEVLAEALGVAAVSSMVELIVLVGFLLMVIGIVYFIGSESRVAFHQIWGDISQSLESFNL